MRAELLGRGAAAGLVEAEPALLELLRIEAGVPWLGRDLDESVLPDEAGLGHAVSDTKGCYTGQEVVARMRSRGRISHRLVGLWAEGERPLPEGAEVRVEGAPVGEVTSAAVSPEAGSIALAYLRAAHAEPGTLAEVEGRPARVSSLPFVSSADEA